MAEETVTVTFQVAGPMKRSTFEREKIDPVAEAINDILHWCWSTRLQIRRLRSSLQAEFSGWNGRPRVRARRKFSATSYDEHLVYVAAANLHRALESVPRVIRSEVRFAKVPGRALRLLRDIYEHWDQLRRQLRGDPTKLRGAGAKLRRDFPGADPWSFTFDPRTGDIVLANVVEVKPLLKELRLLEARLLRRERFAPNKTPLAKNTNAEHN